MNYKNLPLMLSKTNIKINAFIRGLLDIFSFSELQKSRLMLYKTNNECFSVKDEMFYSTRLCLVE